MGTSSINPLKIADVDFLVTTTIERCPRAMMIRELTKNALEAASLAPEGHRLVIFRTVPHGETSKLAIWNSGPGMDAQELYRMCDIASSIGKHKGLDGNFGMGAKVASIPSNKHGIVYRSCKAGKVHEVVLCHRDGRYGRLRRDLGNGKLAEVVDVTEVVRQEGYDLSQDWTEVRLLGSEPGQNTTASPYNGDPVVEDQWLATYLYHRFYRFPDGVRVVLDPGVHKLGAGTCVFEPLPRRAAADVFERWETVDVPGGIKIHYFYDAPDQKRAGHNRSGHGAIQSAQSLVGVVYKDELYDVKTGRAWAVNSPVFGISFGSKHISVHVELPQDAAVLPEAYRQFLRYQGGEQNAVQAEHYADLVAKHRPQWLIEIIRSLAPDGPSSDDLRDELQKLLDELRVQRNVLTTIPRGPRVVGPGSGVAIERSRNGGGADGRGQKPAAKNLDLNLAPQGSKAADLWNDRARAPEIILLRTPARIDELGLRGRAGRYYENGQLFLNMLYPSILMMQDALEVSYTNVSDLDNMRETALRLAERSMVLRVGRAVVFALAKQLNEDWPADAVQQALAPESLSLAADDFYASLQTARRSMSRQFRPGGHAEEPSFVDDDGRSSGVA